jgi:RNA polymerase sigma-70 factor (ECF subfamily)
MVSQSDVALGLADVEKALVTYRGELAALARSLGADVDEVLQLVAIRATRHSDLLRDPTRVRAWLFRILRRVIIDEARSSASRSRRIELRAEVPDVAVPPVDESCGCSSYLASTLEPAQSAILQLVDVGGATLADAARELDISVNNATVRLHRARKKLRERMQEHCGVRRVADCADCRCVYDGCCG